MSADTPRTAIIADNIRIAINADNREQSHTYQKKAIREIEQLERELSDANKRRDEVLSMTEHGWLFKIATRLAGAGCKSDGIVDALDELIGQRDNLLSWKGIRNDDRIQKLERDLVVMNEQRDKIKGQLHMLQCMMGDAGFPRRVRIEDSHGNDDFLHVHPENQLGFVLQRISEFRKKLHNIKTWADQALSAIYDKGAAAALEQISDEADTCDKKQ